MTAVSARCLRRPATGTSELSTIDGVLSGTIVEKHPAKSPTKYPLVGDGNAYPRHTAVTLCEGRRPPLLAAKTLHVSPRTAGGARQQRRPLAELPLGARRQARDGRRAGPERGAAAAHPGRRGWHNIYPDLRRRAEWLAAWRRGTAASAGSERQSIRASRAAPGSGDAAPEAAVRATAPPAGQPQSIRPSTAHRRECSNKDGPRRRRFCQSAVSAARRMGGQASRSCRLAVNEAPSSGGCWELVSWPVIEQRSDFRQHRRGTLPTTPDRVSAAAGIRGTWDRKAATSPRRHHIAGEQLCSASHHHIAGEQLCSESHHHIAGEQLCSESHHHTAGQHLCSESHQHTAGEQLCSESHRHTAGRAALF